MLFDSYVYKHQTFGGGQSEPTKDCVMSLSHSITPTKDDIFYTALRNGDLFYFWSP